MAEAQGGQQQGEADQSVQQNGQGSQQQSNAGGAGDQSNQAGGGQGGQQSAEATKPEGLDDRFWDADKKAVKFGDLNKTVSDLTAFKAEQDSRAAQVPANADAYTLELPKDLKLPEGMTFEIDPKSPLAVEGRKIAHELKLTNDEFGRFVSLYAQTQIAEHTNMQELAGKELEKLGANGKARVDAVQTWLKARVGDELAGVLHHQLYTAKQIEAFEKIMGAFRTAGNPGATNAGREGGGPAALAPEDYAKMSFEERVERSRAINSEKQAGGGRR